ncbi:transporter [Acinetobacter sp. ANC 4470]|uniref:OmpP1/FadL family transporter n=1 Tax=Acinetobacter sp. ANC 4470 TaxID=1977881 RepID=UPI000A34E56A|nr:outer membrane protein transport protein [Acinetobacter sp. ANC 4470]OTG69340.1 transporter [Acinetobacter sp. ANC 4470]
MKLKTLSTAIILATVPMTGVFAAALDRSGQSIAAFLQPGNYFEAGISILDPSVSGKAKAAYGGGNLSDMAGDYYFPSAALKIQATDHFSVGLLYDQPFGADATYSVHDPLVALGTGLFHANGEATAVDVTTQNLSLILGFQPTENWNIYGGAAYQTIKGDVQLRGAAYGTATTFGGYNANIDEDGAVGWLAGVAYQIPEIALKASLTYRSEVEHTVNAKESAIPAGAIPAIINNPALAGKAATGSTDITTPQSINLDLQTGIMANTVAFANVRWVNWKDFALRPYAFGVASAIAGPSVGQPNGFDLVAYTDDQISATVGVGRKLNDKWAGTFSVGWDSGAGNPVSTLGPTEGYWNLGLGLQYSPTAQTFIAGGVKYFWLGDAEAQPASMFGTSNAIADFEDNDALAYGLKIGYKF